MGHIRKTKLKSGKTAYVARFKDASGAERSKSFTRMSDARDFLSESALVPARDKRTLDALLEADAKASVADTTAVIKRSAAKHLGPLSGVSVDAITPELMTAWLGHVNGKGLSPASVRIYYAQYRAAYAVPSLRIPQPVRPPVDIPSPDAVRALVAAASPTVASMVTVQASTGLRPGELCGLRPESVNVGRAVLSVTHQSGRKGWPPEFKALKTRSSIRTLPLPAKALEAILEALEGASSGDPLWLTRTGRQWTSTTYHEAVTNASGGAIKPHSLRHFYASMLIAAGVDVRTVQARLGHATASETLNTYTHLWSDSPESTVAAVDAVL